VQVSFNLTQALCLGKKAKARLRESLEYIIFHSASLLDPIDVKTFSKQLSAKFLVKKPSGFLYACNAALIEAIENKDVATLRFLFTEGIQDLPHSAYLYCPSKLKLNFDVLSHFEKQLVHQSLLLPLPDTAAVYPISDSLFKQTCTKIDQALDIIKHINAMAHQEINALISQIIIIHVAGLYSGSTFGLLGTAFLAPTETKLYVVDYIEGLIHEAAHILLFMLSIEDELFLNAPDELYRSPIRQDARPMGGIFHAYFVATRVLLFFHQLPDPTDLLSTAEINRAKEIVAQFKHVFLESQKLIAHHAHLTPLGKQIFNDCKDLMSTLYNLNQASLAA
jgi:hypothetical protein